MMSGSTFCSLSRRYLTILFLFFCGISFSQEICNNGIDDNGNGLVDLNDPGCTCSPVLTTVPSLIPNPSFETMSCCPSTYSQVNCAQGWVQASSATSDYMNTCGFVFGAATAAGLVPFPSGSGILGCIFAPTWQEYVGSCLTSPMLAGTPYSLQFNVASTPIDGQGDVCNGGVINYSNIDLTLFGATSCSSLPFNGQDCPPAPWVVLGTVNYNPVTSWGVVTINFTPSANINAIILGSPCTLPPSYTYGPTCYPYFYFDNMILNTTSAFSNSVSQTGTMCGNNVVLTGSTTTGAVYQWYHAGVAIVGQTSTTLNISGLGLPAGVYQFSATAGGTCSVATTTVVAQTPATITATSATVCSGGSSAVLTGGGGATYTWSTGAVAPSITVTPAATTVYSVTGTDANGCTGTATATVTVNSSSSVSVTTGSYCTPGSATITASGASTYTWSTGATTASTVVSPAATTVYTVNATSSTGCQSSATTTVTVFPIPTPTASNTSPICANQTLNFSSGGGTSYAWSGPNGFNSASQNPSIPGVTVAAAGVYSVTATDANGCQATATTTVTINPSLLIVATGTTICSNGTINLTATAGGASYAWAGPNSFVSAVQNPIISNATTSMSGTYSVTVLNAGGCIGTATTQVIVNPLPVVVATGTTVCVNGTINLTAGGGISYSWTGPNAYASIAQNPVIVTATTAMTGVYSVTVTDANGCVNATSANVTVNPLPVPTATATTPLCTNQTLILAAGGGTSYAWSGPNSFSSLTQSPNIPAVTTAASGTYTVIVTDVNNCQATATTAVLVNALPVVSVSGSTVCINATANLTSSGGVSYSWSGPNGFNSALQNPSILNAQPNMSGAYVVTVTDANNCVNANSANVLVNSQPTVTVNSASICLGQQTATLIATGAVNYAWTPTTGLSSSVGSSVTGNPSTTTAYTVTGTDANFCQNTATLTVTVNPLPVFTVGPLNSSGCSPVCVSFTNTITGTGTCNWNFGDGTTSSNCTPSHCFTGQGTFNAALTLTDGNGCTGSASANIIVFPNPVADFSASPQPTSILDPHIQFTNLTTGAVISTYSWTLGDANNTTSALANPSITYQAVGTYPVLLVVTSDHGCIDSTIKIIKIEDEFMLYVPNAFSPNADGVNDIFYAKGEGLKDFKMYIYDRWGQQVFVSDDIYKGWDGRYQSRGTDIVQEDVYVWKIECKTTKGEHKMLRGHVSLLK